MEREESEVSLVGLAFTRQIEYLAYFIPFVVLLYANSFFQAQVESFKVMDLLAHSTNLESQGRVIYHMEVFIYLFIS